MEVENQFIEQNLQIISKQTMDLFLSQNNPSDLIGLYMFYYYTAKWQATNQPKSTTGYTAGGLKWSKERVRNIKKQLIALNIIEDIKDIGADGIKSFDMNSIGFKKELKKRGITIENGATIAKYRIVTKDLTK